MATQEENSQKTQDKIEKANREKYIPLLVSSIIFFILAFLFTPLLKRSHPDNIYIPIIGGLVALVSFVSIIMFSLGLAGVDLVIK